MKKGFSIDNMKDITLLVGDQGCGKSSVLELLSSNQSIDLELTVLGQKGVDTRFFDFEKDNPRIKNPELYTEPNGISKGIGYGGALATRFESHGQVLSDFSVRGLEVLKNCIVFFDEPESSLSVRNQFKLITNAKKAVDKKCQLIFATHCIPLIESQEFVYSMEHLKWMKSIEFLQNQKKE
ncbi:MAG: ABC transporter ATP-binding protein [Bacteroidota bacterium]